MIIVVNTNVLTVELIKVIFVSYRYQQFENDRMQKEHEFRLQQVALQNQRRKEERQHELEMMRLLTGHHQVTEDNGNTYFQL